MIGPETLLPVALIALVFFGGAKIPELARSLGRAKKEFQKGIQEGGDEPEGPAAQPSPAPQPEDKPQSH